MTHYCVHSHKELTIFDISSFLTWRLKGWFMTFKLHLFVHHFYVDVKDHCLSIHSFHPAKIAISLSMSGYPGEKVVFCHFFLLLYPFRHIVFQQNDGRREEEGPEVAKMWDSWYGMSTISTFTQVGRQRNVKSERRPFSSLKIEMETF